MRELETERVVIHSKSMEEYRTQVDQATRGRIVESLSEDTYPNPEGQTIYRAIIVRSAKSHLTE